MSGVSANCSRMAVRLHKLNRLSKLLQQRKFASSTSQAKENDNKIDFSKSVEEFKRDGIAILPLKIDTDFVNKSKKLCMAAWEDALLRGRLVKGELANVSNCNVLTLLLL